jgi:prepilin-type N-terminal cleavage/methylation domain-containing protein
MRLSADADPGLVARQSGGPWGPMALVGERQPKEDGFTLVELVVAMTLLAIVAVGFLTSVSLGFRTVAVARQRQTASEIATARLEHLRNVGYDQVANDEAPTHNADPTNPNYFVNGSNYDVTGNGDDETLIVDTVKGDVLVYEDPVQIGPTVMEIYQYVTWVDDPGIPGDENYKRVTVVVRYKAPSSNGVNQFVRASTLISPGTVTFTPGATTTTTAPSSSTTLPPTTTTTTAASCPGDTSAPTGSVAIGASGSADAGYTASSNVSLNMSFTDSCTPIVASFSNDNITWDTDVVYDSGSPQVSWPLSAGNGAKTIYARVRDGAGNTATLSPLTVILDASAPTAPSGVAHTVSCQGSNRTINITWGASSDAEGNLKGYRVFRSTDAVNWTAIGTTSALTLSNTHSKNSTTMMFKLVAYDKAGNESASAPTPPISLVKNQCS